MNGATYDEATSPRLGVIIAAGIARQQPHVQDQLSAALGTPGGVTLEAVELKGREHLIIRVDGRGLAVVPRDVLEPSA